MTLFLCILDLIDNYALFSNMMEVIGKIELMLMLIWSWLRGKVNIIGGMSEIREVRVVIALLGSYDIGCESLLYFSLYLPYQNKFDFILLKIVFYLQHPLLRPLISQQSSPTLSKTIKNQSSISSPSCLHLL